MRRSLWNRLREGDKVIKDGLAYTVTGVSPVAGCEPNLVMLSAPYTPQYRTQMYNCYECATSTVNRLLDEIEAMDKETPAAEPKPNVRTIELRIPEPGDELPFTVYDNGKGGGLQYDEEGDLMYGLEQQGGWCYGDDLAVALGLPGKVSRTLVVTEVKEQQS